MVGTVIASNNGPAVNHFSFVLKENNDKAVPIQKGQFIQLNSMGILIAMVENIIKTNRYFDHAEAVSEYERGGLPLSAIFPADRWEYIIAFAKPLGLFNQNNLTRVSFPLSPGDKVYLVDESILSNLIGLDPTGLALGKICYQSKNAKKGKYSDMAPYYPFVCYEKAPSSYFVKLYLNIGGLDLSATSILCFDPQPGQ